MEKIVTGVYAKMNLLESFCEKCNKPLVSSTSRPKSFPCLCSECYKKQFGDIDPIYLMKG